MDCENKQKLGGFVYIDQNNNGRREGSDKGIKNVSIELLNSQDKVLATALTKDTGEYAFGVCEDDYILKANYTQGDNSYLDRTSVTVSNTKLSDQYNFVVLKSQDDILTTLVWVVVGVVGFTALFLTQRLLRKN